MQTILNKRISLLYMDATRNVLVTYEMKLARLPA